MAKSLSKPTKPAAAPRTKAATTAKKGRWRRWGRRMAKLSLASIIFVLGLWIAIHRVTWLGPALADGARSVAGPRAVAWLEDFAYGLQDRFNRWRYHDAKPVEFWAAPEPSAGPRAPGAPPTALATASAQVDEPVFALPHFEPPFPTVAGEGDGTWVSVRDPGRVGESARVFKTIVHPDKRRSFAGLAIIAMDLHAYELHLVAGTREPKTFRVHPKDRKGLVPAEDISKLFAAFNGGFKTTHGHYGMMLGGIEFLPPRGYACTFVRYQDGRFDIAVWSDIAKRKGEMSYYRQTPPCLVHSGKIHKQLHYHEYAKGWGATVSGDTVIRRSAIGLDRTRQVLFYGLGEAMTAQAMARGMNAAGADAVAELDVNHAYPRFLFFDHDEKKGKLRATRAIIEAIEYTPDRYVERPAPRDFFYLTRRQRQASR